MVKMTSLLCNGIRHLHLQRPIQLYSRLGLTSSTISRTLDHDRQQCNLDLLPLVSSRVSLHTSRAVCVKSTPVTCVSVTQRACAGHSKWQNIRHIKGAKDAQKAQMNNRYVKDIMNAIKDGNGPDPKFNNLLARVLERASNDDVPKQTIQNALKRATEGKPRSTLYYDMKGPGNCALIVEAFTDNSARTKNDLTAIGKKLGGKLSDSGNQFLFDKKGNIFIAADGRSFEQAEEIAIETGAEEIEEESENGEDYYKLICSDAELFIVKKMIELKNIEIVRYEMDYVPNTLTTISDDSQTTLMKLLDKIENLDEVVKVFDNVDIQEEE